MSVAETNSAAATTENMTNNNDNTNEEHETMEDNINEAASEDSGMSSVDNNNVSGIINIFGMIFDEETKYFSTLMLISIVFSFCIAKRAPS